MGYEPLRKLPFLRHDIEGLNLKGLYIRGVIGRDFKDLRSVHRVARKEAKSIFKVNQDKIVILRILEVPEMNGFLILATNCVKKGEKEK